jgi:hypothetical protein
MSEREIAGNFFIIKKVRALPGADFYRVTLENQYVGTEDINIVMLFSVTPEAGQKVQVTMESC